MHDKTQTINYLPLVAFNEFMETHGHFELLEQELQDANDALRRAADPMGLKEALELELPIESLFAEMTAAPAQTALALGISPAKLDKYFLALSAARNRVQRIKALLGTPRVAISDFSPLCSPKALMKYKLAVARNTVGDLHFLPPCRDLISDPCVVLLRRVATCSIDLLRLAENCMSQGEWDFLRAEKTTPDFHSAVVKPERLLRLKSPYIESLMSRFGVLFGRVGTRDIERSQLESYVGISERL